MPKTIEIDAAVIAKMSAEGLTGEQAAERLGINQASLYYKLKNDPEIKAAWYGNRPPRKTPAPVQSPDEAAATNKVLKAIREGAEYAPDIVQDSGLDKDTVKRVVGTLIASGVLSRHQSSPGVFSYAATIDQPAEEAEAVSAPDPAPVKRKYTRHVEAKKPAKRAGNGKVATKRKRKASPADVAELVTAIADHGAEIEETTRFANHVAMAATLRMARCELEYIELYGLPSPMNHHVRAKLAEIDN